MATPERAVATRHQCYICQRTYERQDHLSRHLKSHSNDRSHRCPDCGKGFNRPDLLNRHQAAHGNKDEGFRRRTGRACEACIKAKTKCDDERPCARCKTRDLVCEETAPRSNSKLTPQVHEPNTNLSSDSWQDTSTLSPGPWRPQSTFVDPWPMMSSNPNDASMLDFAPTGFDFPDFFQQIMMPDASNGVNEANLMPPDVFNFTQDMDFDASDFDFSIFASGLTRPGTPQADPAIDMGSNASVGTTQSDAQRRSEVFKRSPWSWHEWIPPQNSNAFSEHDEINVQEDGVNEDQQLTSPNVTRFVHCEMDHVERDRMIRLVSQVTHRKLAMPSFPSLKLLEDLVDVFLIQDSHAIDGFIHAASCDYRDMMTELLLGMVAAGARHVALAPVWKTGLVIQEIVRIALGEVFENANEYTRDIQALQTYFLWLDIGIWSGSRRKTEVATSFLQPAITMLSWANALMKFRYKDIVPSADDSDSVLIKKWKAWTEQEGLKRLVIHAFIHDSQAATVNMNGFLLAPAQMLIPLPASRKLWLAPNAHAWRNVFLTLKPPTQAQLPSLMEVFSDSNILDKFESSVDKALCLLAACHAIGHEVRYYQQKTKLLSCSTTGGRKDRWLAHANWQRDLYDDLTTLQIYIDMQDKPANECMFILEFTLMSLHVSLEDIQTFSGKSGEDEARKAFPSIRAWTQDSQSRKAIWHAGQVFRIAKSLDQTRLRDFYAVAFHHAALTLWVYGMVMSNLARESGDQTPIPQTSSRVHQSNGASTQTPPQVLVDQKDDRVMKSFVILAQGTPAISAIDNSCVPLQSSKTFMTSAGEILRANYPQTRNGLPPLVENIANLMNELGKLSGRE